MGGAFRGGGGAPQVVKAAEEAKPAPAPGVEKPTQAQEQEGARMRGARRRGRQLLSDARLMGEMGAETLGGGANLG